MSDNSKDDLVENSSTSIENESNASDSRRKAVRNILAGSGLTLGAATSGSWVAPVVNSVVTPAHAQTSAAMPTVLAGNASLSPASPKTVANSVLDFLVPAAHAGAVAADMNLGGACIIVTFSSATSFSISIQLTTGPAMILAGTAAGSMLSASGSGIIFNATVDFTATPATAAGTLVSGLSTFNFTISSATTSCAPMAPATTTAAPSTTTGTPSTTTTMTPTTAPPPPTTTTMTPTTAPPPPTTTTMTPTTAPPPPTTTTVAPTTPPPVI